MFWSRPRLFRWDAPLFFTNAELFNRRVLDAVESAPMPLARCRREGAGHQRRRSSRECGLRHDDTLNVVEKLELISSSQRSRNSYLALQQLQTFEPQQTGDAT